LLVVFENTFAMHGPINDKFYKYFTQAKKQRTISSLKYRPLETFGDVFRSEIRYCMMVIVFGVEE